MSDGVLRGLGVAVLACLMGTSRPAAAAPDDLTRVAVRPASPGATVLTIHTSDDGNDGTCDAIHCSLREAIDAANRHDGPDTIEFDIPDGDPGCDGAGVCTIRPVTALPPLAGDATTIDGFTQPGAAPNTNPFGEPINAVLKIVLDGSLLTECCPAGLSIRSAGSRVRGLVVHGFYEAISLIDATDTRIEGNFVGTDVSGRVAPGNECAGIILSGFVGSPGSANNVVGGATPDARNLISGNGCSGVEIGPVGANVVQGNYIGTDATGAGALGNRGNGVRVFNASSDNRVGGALAGEANLLAFNSRSGVTVDGGFGAARNTVSRNRIHDNGGAGIALTAGGNGNLAAPVIADAGAAEATGTACAGCTVEVFSDAADEGALYEGTTVADGAGDWRFDQPAGLQGPRVTATATDALGNTSPFSAPVVLPPPTPTATPSPTTSASVPTATPTPTATRPPSPTATAACTGDCDGGGSVTIDELIRGVNLALGGLPLSACPVFDRNGDGRVSIDEVVRAVNAALAGCP